MRSRGRALSLSLPPCLFPLSFSLPLLFSAKVGTQSLCAKQALSPIPAQPVFLSVMSKMEDILNEAKRRLVDQQKAGLESRDACQDRSKDSSPPSLSPE